MDGKLLNKIKELCSEHNYTVHNRSGNTLQFEKERSNKYIYYGFNPEELLIFKQGSFEPFSSYYTTYSQGTPYQCRYDNNRPIFKTFEKAKSYAKGFVKDKLEQTKAGLNVLKREYIILQDLKEAEVDYENE